MGAGASANAEHSQVFEDEKTKLFETLCMNDLPPGVQTQLRTDLGLLYDANGGEQLFGPLALERAGVLKALESEGKKLSRALSPIPQPPCALGNESSSAYDKTFRQRRLSYATVPGDGTQEEPPSNSPEPVARRPSMEFRSPEFMGEASPLRRGGRATRLTVRPSALLHATSPGRLVARCESAPFADAFLGTFSYHGIEPGYYGRGATAKINQDRGCVVHPFGGAGNRSLFAVFDGHGEHGQDVSEFVAEHVVERLEERLIDDSGDAKHALVATFADVDFALRKSRVEAHYSGTTAVVVYRDGQKLYTANAGDSRAILARRVEGKLQALPLSKDHNPDLPDERARIVAAGGYVSDAPEVGLSARVWLDKAHTQVGLAMARSIGDNAVTAVGVISLPEVTEHVLLPNDEFLIAATDGVWEFITNDEAIDLVAAHLALEPPSAKVACERLIQLAVARWKAIEGDYRDDITCIVMDCRALYSTASADAPAPPSAQASAPAPAQ